MKRTITLILALSMLLLLTACGNDTTNENNPTLSENVVEKEETTETKTTDESKTETSSFDTSWASNDFEALIPELPFKGWTVLEESDSSYKLELGGLKTANGADTDSGYEEDKDALIKYLNSLETYGFTVEEKGEGYKWCVNDKNGNTINFTCSDGYCWVEFKKAG